MNGGENRKPWLAGYTIIEVLIFLAISGFMFVVAAIFINGKQANAEFQQGINDANTQIRTVMNDVVNGFYPSNNDFECTVTGLTTAPRFDKLVTHGQGSNLGCTFIGKVIQFGVKGTGDASSGWSGYNVYTVAARQYASGSTTQLPQNFAQALPKAAVENGVDLTDVKSFHWGLAVTKVCVLPDSGCDHSGTPASSSNADAIGFFGSFGNFGSGTALQSGSQSVNVVLIPGTSYLVGSGNGKDETTAVASINSGLPTSSPLAAPNILICFEGTNSKTASITIGGTNGQQLTTSIKIGDSRC